MIKNFSTAEEALGHITSATLPQNPYLTVDLRILPDNVSKTLELLNEVLDPNKSIHHSITAFTHVREMIYLLGHTLEKGLGFSNLEKLGISLIDFEDHFKLNGEFSTTIPRVSIDNIKLNSYFNGIAELPYILAECIENGSSVASKCGNRARAVVKINEEIDNAGCLLSDKREAQSG